MKNFVFNPKNNTLVVKKESIIPKHIKFNGKIIVGMYSNLWGNLEARNVLLGKNCHVAGKIVCENVIVGAYTKFNSIHAKNAILLSKCRGRYIKGVNVKIGEGSSVYEVVADNLLLFGHSKFKKLVAKKTTALKF